MEVPIVVIVCFALLLVGVTWIAFNLYSKLTIIETKAEEIYLFADEAEDKAMKFATDFVENLKVEYEGVFEELTRIDRLGSFKADDEVGFVFNKLKSSIESINQFNSRLVGQLKTVDDGDM